MARGRALPWLNIVPVRGGLGNQLFCWAYGRALEAEGHRVIFDVSDGLGRGFALRGLIGRSKKMRIPRRIYRLLRVSSIRTVTHISFWEERQDRPPICFSGERGIFIHWGYWQSLEYFDSIKMELIDEVSAWANPQSSGETPYCAVHVRRGDYVSDLGAAKTLGALPLEYYQLALDRMRSEGFSRFIVFSDDRNWADENLVATSFDVEMSREGDLMEDFRGIANADAVITANSSFSWWATLSGTRPERPVISPEHWFANTEFWNGSIVPTNWERL